MMGFTTVLLVVVLAGSGPTGALPAPDSVCVRTSHYFPEIRRSVRCYSAAGFIRWQQAEREGQRAARLQRRRLEVARLDRRRWDERLRREYQDRRRDEARQAERRRRR